MQFFGLLGTASFLVGFLISLYLIIAKIINIDFSITNRPGFYIALTTMMIGSQLFLAGFVGELVSRNANDRNNYNIESTAGI